MAHQIAYSNAEYFVSVDGTKFEVRRRSNPQRVVQSYDSARDGKFALIMAIDDADERDILLADAEG